MKLDDPTHLPVPEGWLPWRPAGAGRLIAFTADGVGRLAVDRGIRGVDCIVEAANGDELHRIVVGSDDNGEAALHRCMVAVGLAPQWSTAVPTEPGRYLVKRPGKSEEVNRWTLGAGRLQVGAPPWCSFAADGWKASTAFEPGTKFMPCPTPEDL